MNFSENLIELRKSKGWSQEELGYKLDVTRQTVSKWELGQTTPEMDKLIELSRLFNTSIDILVGKVGVQGEEGIHTFNQFHYEYKSEKKLFGLPLIHVNIGIGIYKAKGIIAIGTIAKGIISLGAISIGLLSLGAISIGLLAFGALAIALLAIGGFAIGGIAIGGISLGYLALGGLAIGVYSIGGSAIAQNIALGGYASGHIAIGDKATGDIVWNNVLELKNSDYDQIKEVIFREYPNTWRWILNIFVKLLV